MLIVMVFVGVAEVQSASQDPGDGQSLPSTEVLWLLQVLSLLLPLGSLPLHMDRVSQHNLTGNILDLIFRIQFRKIPDCCS